MTSTSTTLTRDSDPTFGTLLRHYRVAAGLSQGELAERAGLSERAISDLERGARRTPRRETLRLLGDALELVEPDRTQLTAAVGARARPAARNGAQVTTALPAPLTSFVGREQEVAALRSVIRRPATRLLTLTGAGGIGKTRLAVRVAESVTESFPDGAVFVDLADLPEPALLPAAISQTFGVRPAAGQEPDTALTEHLEGKRTLLVLDNCERVLAASAWLADLLRASHGLTVLATSRAVLRLQPERVYQVPPLALPAARRLFLERAQAADPSVRPRASTNAAIAELCRRLDGLPLAIELAAARARVLPPDALLARLDTGLAVLGGGGEDRPPRQRTIAATLDWSYALLDPPRQRLFARMGVFAGDCGLEAIEAVGAPNDGVRSVLDSIAMLVEHSLLRRIDAQEDAAPRFSMLEPVREYAAERLRASEEETATRRIHAAYYVTLAERGRPQLDGSGQVLWLRRLDAEHANLRAALAWTQEAGEAELGLRLAAASWEYWQTRGYLIEGRRWLTAALAKGTEVSAEVRAGALSGAGALAGDQGDYHEAILRLEEALMLRRELGDDEGMAWTLNNLGVVHFEQGDLATAQALFAKSLALKRWLGMVHALPDTLNNLGAIAHHLGEPEEAIRLHQEALKLSRKLGLARYIAYSANGLAWVLLDLGRAAAAAALVREALLLSRDMQEAPALLEEVVSMAVVAWKQGRPQRSARLWGAAERARQELDIPECPVGDSDLARWREPIVGQYAAVVAEGQTMSLEQAVAYALTEEEPTLQA